MTITKKEYENYQRLLRLESSGHLLTTDGLRFIIAANEGDAERVGKHFLEVYGKWTKTNWEA